MSMSSSKSLYFFMDSEKSNKIVCPEVCRRSRKFVPPPTSTSTLRALNIGGHLGLASYGDKTYFTCKTPDRSLSGRESVHRVKESKHNVSQIFTRSYVPECTAGRHTDARKIKGLMGDMKEVFSWNDPTEKMSQRELFRTRVNEMPDVGEEEETEKEKEDRIKTLESLKEYQKSVGCDFSRYFRYICDNYDIWQKIQDDL